MNNRDIFTQQNPPRTSRSVTLPDGGVAYSYSSLAIGEIQGAKRTLRAAMNDESTIKDMWRLVQLKEFTSNAHLETVAILGALDEDQARAWALKTFGLGYESAEVGYNTVTTSANALIRLLGLNASQGNFHITQNMLDNIASQLTEKPVEWKDNSCELVSYGGDTSRLLHEMVRLDDENQLADSMNSGTDLAVFLAELGANEVDDYNALVVEFAKFDTFIGRIDQAMSKAAIGKLTIANTQVTKPFKKNNVVNVAKWWELSDGQTITIVFHNPDSTPGTLKLTDMLTSWKFMLNKRDITAAASPPQGKNVQPLIMAQRLMSLAEKNSARFVRANKDKAEKEAALVALNESNVVEQEAVAGILADNEVLQKQIDEVGRQGAKPTAKEPKKPYSENIIAALVANHGWTDSTESSATKEFTGMAAGGELSDGTRMLTARFDNRGRYIGIDKDGFDSAPIPETDMDMRDYMTDAQGGAKAFNDMVEAYVAKRRETVKAPELKTTGITSWDSQQADADFAVILAQHNGDYVAASKVYFAEKLLGTSVQTKIGKVWINDTTKRKMQHRLSKTKAKVINRIPEILIDGSVGERTPLDKQRDDNIVAFYQFDKWLDFDDVRIHARIKVGEVSKGKLAYYLAASANEEASSFNSSGADSDESLQPKGLQKTRLATIQAEDDDSVNIEILEVVYKKPLSAPVAPVITQSTAQASETFGKQASETIAQPPQNANEPFNGDVIYLTNVINGDVDFSYSDELEHTLEQISERLTPETEQLFEQAAEAFAQYAIAQAATV